MTLLFFLMFFFLLKLILLFLFFLFKFIICQHFIFLIYSFAFLISSCFNIPIQVEHLPFGVGSAPQGGTQHFSHHAFAITGAEVPAWSREHAWRFAYFFDDESGATTMNKEGKNRKPLTLEEKKRKEEAGHKAWQAFVEKEAPKRLANRKPLPNDPTAYREIKGKTLSCFCN